MNNSHRFFNNRECKYFPCHTVPDADQLNCLFCYCPLYAHGAQCGGFFSYTKKGVKNCMGCRLPHMPEYYDTIIDKLAAFNEKNPPPPDGTPPAAPDGATPRSPGK